MIIIDLWGKIQNCRMAAVTTMCRKWCDNLRLRIFRIPILKYHFLSVFIHFHTLSNVFLRRKLYFNIRIRKLRSPMWKSRYQGTNFCQAFLGNVSRSWQKFAPWYLLFHHVTCKRCKLSSVSWYRSTHRYSIMSTGDK